MPLGFSFGRTCSSVWKCVPGTGRERPPGPGAAASTAVAPLPLCGNGRPYQCETAGRHHASSSTQGIPRPPLVPRVTTATLIAPAVRSANRALASANATSIGSVSVVVRDDFGDSRTSPARGPCGARRVRAAPKPARPIPSTKGVTASKFDRGRPPHAFAATCQSAGVDPSPLVPRPAHGAVA